MPAATPEQKGLEQEGLERTCLAEEVMKKPTAFRSLKSGEFKSCLRKRATEAAAAAAIANNATSIEARRDKSACGADSEGKCGTDAPETRGLEGERDTV